MNADKLAAWIKLKQAPGLGQKTALKLLELYPDPQDFVGKSSHPIHKLDWLPASARGALRDPEPPANMMQIIKLAERYEIGFCTFMDDDYPQMLRELFSPPLILYYRGDLELCDSQYRLAVVGTRKPSSYGQEMARKLLAPLCERGLCIVSGLAMGIDTVAHRTALEHGGKTVAVLAGGLESIYPPMNKNLADRIAKMGLLLSEYEPGSKMEKWNFPARNRIVSALSTCVFIVEGALSSGALLTGKFALEQNRDICALPGNINHTNAQGPNYMIKTGASLITAPEDLMALLGMDEETATQQMNIFPELSPDEESIYRRLQESPSEISFDELLLASGHGFGKLSVILLNLELKGLVSKAGSGSYIAN